MENFNGEIIIKPKNIDKYTLEDIGNSIHMQLIGNQDYINNNIKVNINTDCVLIQIDECVNEIPYISF